MPVLGRGAGSMFALHLQALMNFSRNQLIGGLILLVLIWMVIFYRMLFSAA